MTENPRILELDGQELVDFVDGLNIEGKKAMVQNVIIPRMNIRSGRAENMSSVEIHEKLERISFSGKPGESHEFLKIFNETMQSAAQDAYNKHCPMKAGVTPEIASEAADIAYYGLQPNAEDPDILYGDINCRLFEIFIGIPLDNMVDFCIIKYLVRLKHGNYPDFKEIENYQLEQYLEKHQELVNLWNEHEPSQPQRRPGEIWYHVHGEEYPE